MKTLLGHMTIIISLMYVVFFGIDRVNRSMEFIDNDITKFLLVVLCVLAMVNACIVLKSERRRVRRQGKLKRRK